MVIEGCHKNLRHVEPNIQQEVEHYLPFSEVMGHTCPLHFGKRALETTRIAKLNRHNTRALCISKNMV